MNDRIDMRTAAEIFIQNLLREFEEEMRAGYEGAETRERFYRYLQTAITNAKKVV